MQASGGVDVPSRLQNKVKNLDSKAKDTQGFTKWVVFLSQTPGSPASSISAPVTHLHLAINLEEYMHKYNNGINPFDVKLITVIIFIFTLFILGMGVDSTRPSLCIEYLPKHMIRVDPSLALAPNLALASFEDFESVDYYVVTARVTAYAPFDNQSGLCADDTPSTTSVGHVPSSNFIAVDPSLIPYGTKVFIPGYGLTIAGDTGGALRSYDGYAIDVFMDTYEEAMDFGIQYLEVKIYDLYNNKK